MYLEIREREQLTIRKLNASLIHAWQGIEQQWMHTVCMIFYSGGYFIVYNLDLEGIGGNME